jgi:hypothetical protein
MAEVTRSIERDSYADLVFFFVSSRVVEVHPPRTIVPKIEIHLGVQIRVQYFLKEDIPDIITNVATIIDIFFIPCI